MQSPGLIFRPLCFGILLLATLPYRSAAAEPEIRVSPIQMIEEDRDAKSLGRLKWRGGFAMTMKDRRFGGLSALQVSADGRHLVAVTDHGNWFRAELTYRDGDLSGIQNPELMPLLDPDGKPLRKFQSDAESLAQLGPTSFAVGFERDHRLWRYDGTPDHFLARAQPIPGPDRLAKLPDNGGIEASTLLCDGKLLIIAERSRTAQGHVEAWVQTKTGWSALTYPVKQGLRPTGATTMSNCDVLVVERSFSIISGLEIRIAQLTAADIGRQTALAPREVARLLPPVSLDNFEGISVRQTIDGETLVYIVSDDNFSPLQQTLLVMFQLEK